MKYKFAINGLRHHDFGGRLDELYELAPGRRMSISIEHDNPQERNAVIVYWGKYFIGYVRSGAERKLAYSIIKTSGRGAILGKIVDVDRENRWLWMEITTDGKMNVEQNDEPNILTNWNFDGETLPSDEPELRLHSMLCDLETTVENQEPWDDDMEQWLEYTERNYWRDISKETTDQMERILCLLTSGSKVHPEYELKAKRLQAATDLMGSPEVRRAQALQILKKADSEDMNILLRQYGNHAQEAVEQLPEELRCLFKEDGEMLMGRLWYFHVNYKKMQAVKTLLAMMIRLKDEEEKKDTPSIPEQWLLAWGARQKDKAKAEVVQEIVGTFEMEKNNPELARQIQFMIDGCNVPLQQTKLLKEIALQPKTENNFGKGSVSIGPGATLMGNVNTNEHSNK